ncbi:MAG: methylthioribulose 1-phosphate dehydratase [Myxococcales bacterium]|nr:methylthioribulose 1-phosphate dehydratase [Myxococcales bacterium]
MIFCLDFDGTITARDMIVSIAEAFCPPEWEAVKDAILDRRLDVRAGVARIFAMIPSARRDEIVAFARKHAVIRPGFEAFLEDCARRRIPVHVVSGGVDFFVEPVLAPFRDRLGDVYWIEGDFSGPTIALRHPWGSETEGTDKVRILRRYPGERTALVGDSVTDLPAARVADLVYARDRLQGYLDEEARPYAPFETFDDIRADLAARLALVAVGRSFDARGWVLGTSGNFSARLPGGARVITPSGAQKGEVEPTDFLRLEPGAETSRAGRPSAERVIHDAVYEAVPTASCVLHAHSPYATLASDLSAPGPHGAPDFLVAAGLEMVKGLGLWEDGAAARIPVFDNHHDIPAIAREIAAHLRADPHAPPTLLIRGHGITAWGPTVEDARRHLEITEFLCRMAWERRC